MSDDITFCHNTHCRNTECERNPVNIKKPYQYHSYGFFKDCEYWDIPTTYFAVAGKQEKQEDGDE